MSLTYKQTLHTLCCCYLILATIDTISTLENNKNNKPANLVSVELKSVRDFGRTLVQCLASMDKVKCLEMRVLEGLDAAMRDNSTWEYSDFLLIEKSDTVNFTYGKDETTQRQSRTLSFADSIGEKLLNLAEGRTVRLKLPPAKTLLRLPAGISDAVEQFSNAVTTSKPITIPINNDEFNGVFAADVGVADLVNAEEGRKKKDKDKHMASLGGMAMMAMMAQLFFGKVLMIAGTAFIMAKIALLVSLLGSLKKGSTGSSSGSTDHVIVTSAGGGGGGHDSPGWHRSMPYEVPNLEIRHAEEEHYESPPVEYIHSSSGPPSPSTLHHPPTASGPPKNYYNYKMVEGETEDDGGGFLRRYTAGFL